MPERRKTNRRGLDRLKLKHLRRRHVAIMAAAVGAVVVVLALLSGSAGPPNELLPPAPHLRDVTGRLIIGCGYDGAVSAPEVCRAGRVLGVLFDDSTPDIRFYVGLAELKYSFIIVLRAPGERGCPYPQPPVLCALEVYPYNSGRPAWEWGPMRRAHAYVIQWLYSFTGRPPTVRERDRLLREARAFRPRLILLF